MKIGLLLPRGSGPAELVRAGQWSRFARSYLRPYASAFERLVLLVEEPPGRLDGGADGIEVRRLRRRGGAGPRWRTEAFQDLDAVRAFQAPDLALLPEPAPPAAATFGFDYDAFARLEPLPWRAFRLRRRARAGARRASVLFSPDAALERRALALAPGARIEPLANGADLTRFVPPERLRPLRRALYVGRLEPQKDLSTLLRALALVPPGRRPPLTIAGEGSQRARLRALALRLGVAAEFIGGVPHESLPDLYAEHELFILPSLEEGQCKALIEAMACSLACVASDCEGNRALIEFGSDGWLFSRRDPAALARRLEEVLGMEEAALFGVRRAARRAAERRHDLHALVKREIAVMRDLAEPGSDEDLDAKYRRSGAYHWRETDRRDRRSFNAFLDARYARLEKLAPATAALALDAGCGDGALGARLAPRVGRMIGCDPSRSALRLAHSRLPQTWWVCARMEALPIRDGVIDLAVAADALEHAADARAAASELRRTLAPRGALLASAPSQAPGSAPGRFHRREFGAGALADLMRECFTIDVERRSHPGWLVRLYESRPLGRGWAKAGIDLLALAGIDLFGLPAGDGARQATLRARPRPDAGHSRSSSAAATASAASVAGDMKRKCG